MMSSWISLNRTEKNSRDIIENLVLQTENQIIYESNNWNSTSESKKEEGDKKDEDQEWIINKIKQQKLDKTLNQYNINQFKVKIKK